MNAPMNARAAAPVSPRRDALQPAVFLDKDGTLLRDVPYNVDPARMVLAPGAAAALRRFARLRLPIVVVSNQPGVALGRFREAELDAVRARLEEICAEAGARLLAFLWCPHAPTADGAAACACRKPMPGLLLVAAQRFGIALSESWMIGDILDDVEAGARAGCRTILIDNGNETVWKPGVLRRPQAQVRDLAAAARCVAAAVGARAR